MANSPARPDITDLTVCRAGFAAAVFIYHIALYTGVPAWLGPIGTIIRHGYLGVDGFFVLSGLILGLVHPDLAAQPQHAPGFWGKRLARIYPVHLATIAVLAVLLATGLALGHTPRTPARFTALSLIENLLLIHGWGVSNFLAWNYPSWSISTEWAGYLAFPVILYFIAKWDAIVLVPAVLMALCVLGAVDYFSGETLNLTYGGALIRFFPEFFAGMAAARLVPIFADEFPTRFLGYAGLALALLGACVESDSIAVIGLFVLITALGMQADAGRAPLFTTNRIALFLGRLSYAFYMSFCTAELITTQVFRQQSLDPAGHAFLFAGLMTLLTFAYAIILHVFVEVPARRAADRWLEKPQPLASAALRL